MYLLITKNQILLLIITNLFLFCTIEAREGDRIKYQPFKDERSIDLYNLETGINPYSQPNYNAFPDDDTGETNLNNPDPFLDDDQ